MQVAKTIFTWVAQKKIFINLIEFFKQSLHLKNYSNSSFFFEKQRVLSFIVLREKNLNSYE